jgi:hypothetical protein
VGITEQNGSGARIITAQEIFFISRNAAVHRASRLLVTFPRSLSSDFLIFEALVEYAVIGSEYVQ